MLSNVHCMPNKAECTQALINSWCFVSLKLLLELLKELRKMSTQRLSSAIARSTGIPKQMPRVLLGSFSRFAIASGLLFALDVS